MQRVFVTGATGFLGSAVARALVHHGFEVCVLLRKGANTWRLGRELQRMQMLNGTLDDPDSFATGLVAFRPDTTMHFAWKGVSKSSREDPSQVRTNVSGSVELLWASIRAGCDTFIGVGSQAEYGRYEGAIDEDQPTRPDTLYGAAKLATLTILEQVAHQHGLRFAWLRVFSLYGPGDTEDTLLSVLINNLLSKRRPILTSCEQRWDYLFVDDAADAFVTVGRTARAAGVLNLGSGTAPPLCDTVSKVRDLIDPSLPLGFGEFATATRPGHCCHPLVGRLQAVTGWSATTPLLAGLNRTVEWHKQTIHGSCARFVVPN